LGRGFKWPMRGVERRGLGTWTVRLVLIAGNDGILNAYSPEKLLETLGAKLTWIKADFSQHGPDERVHVGRLKPGTEDLKALAGAMAQQRLGDLTAGRVRRADEEGAGLHTGYRGSPPMTALTRARAR
jgi:hypothetical protein